jgi:hypothetical protein
MELNRKDFRGELHGTGGYIGHVYKTEGGYMVFEMGHRYSATPVDGRLLQASDLLVIGFTRLSASRSVRKFQIK